MNIKEAKKIRKETRLYWNIYLHHLSALSFRERVKIAPAVVFLRRPRL